MVKARRVYDIRRHDAAIEQIRQNILVVTAYIIITADGSWQFGRDCGRRKGALWVWLRSKEYIIKCMIVRTLMLLYEPDPDISRAEHSTQTTSCTIASQASRFISPPLRDDAARFKVERVNPKFQISIFVFGTITKTIGIPLLFFFLLLPYTFILSLSGQLLHVASQRDLRSSSRRDSSLPYLPHLQITSRSPKHVS